MAEIISHMNGDELRNNYEFKVVRRALMKEYPWIKDVIFNEDDLQRYNLIFLDLVIDPAEMGEAYGYEMNPWVTSRVARGENYHATFPSLIFNVPYEQAKDEVNVPINKMMEQIHDSPALPEDLRLPQGRQFQVGSFTVNPDGPAW